MSQPPAKSPESPLDDAHVTPKVYITSNVPGLGGSIKNRPEDFIVEELPQYEPSGEGEHLYLFIEKSNLSTFELVRIVSRHFGVRHDEVGYAGLKDRMAVTRQVLSIHLPHQPGVEFPSIRHDRINVLWAARHANKLRIGHLKGNHFAIKIRGVPPEGARAADRVLRELAATGVPNRIGEQRFGFLQNNHLVARAMIAGNPEEAARILLSPGIGRTTSHDDARAAYVAGDLDAALNGFPISARTERIVLHALKRGESAAEAMSRIDAAAASFFMNAFQSAIFNTILDTRITENSFRRVELGDIAIKHVNRAAFLVDDAAMADPGLDERLRTFDISPSGPLWGPTMLRAGGRVGAMESEALAATGVTEDDLARVATRLKGVEGSRRPLRVPVIEPDVEGGIDEHGTYVRCSFELPRGAFATVVLREIMKPNEPIDEESEAEDRRSR